MLLEAQSREQLSAVLTHGRAVDRMRTAFDLARAEIATQSQPRYSAVA